MIGAILATLVGVIGYHFIHRFNKVGAWFMGSALLIGMILMAPGLNAEVLRKAISISPAGSPCSASAPCGRSASRPTHPTIRAICRAPRAS
ncbi:hypothetical protein [Paraburkholderia sp. Ac-20347]|uniref:hypothetical protein n=1 Tax=Paraburkholderia sp. Ac-20347 TaxID=2703892 RepID=UPI001F128764|nr:hypothetical protein [Paraburkholderia sp. Ac-20347]